MNSINVDVNSQNYVSVDGLVYSKDKTTLIAVPAGLAKVDIISSVTKIGDSAFEGCTGLTNLDISNSVTSIGSYAFYGCAGLTNLDIPNSVTSIGSYAFYGCAGLTNLDISNSVTSIGSYAFYGCAGLTNLDIPNSVTSIGSFAFSGCKLDYLLIQGSLQSYSSIFSGLSCDAVFVPEDQMQTAEKYWSGNLYSISSAPYACIAVKSYPTVITFKVFENPYVEISSKIQKVTVSDKYSYTNSLTPNSEGLYVAKNLRANYLHYLNITYKEDGMSRDKSTGVTVYTANLVNLSVTSTGQTYVRFKVSLNDDPYCNEIQEYGIRCGVHDTKADENGVVTIKNLHPKTEYDFLPYKKTDDGTFYYSGYESISITTNSLYPRVWLLSSTPTTVSLGASYAKGDAEVVSTGITGYDTDGKNMNFTGLMPKYNYKFKYYVKMADGYQETATLEVNTPPIEWETLPAKATSNTVALICANTNIDEEETGTGFEWRRYDAPDLVPSTQAPCPVVDGTLTGALKNLSASTYYKFRPYYKSASGNMYYGDWLAFGTADAYVYFDPTVRTYEATEVGDNSAKVKGFAIGGSDDITEQGFEYWKTAGSSASPKRVPVKAADNDGTQSVIATGQWMTATLNDLAAGTTYSFRAYVKTANGITYGEEMNFTTTGVATAIGEVEEAQDVVEVARYTIDGRRIQTPQRGINIVRYSDGTTRKIYVK